MTAQRLATALLDGGEDPKAFLRRVAPRLRMPSATEVEYDLSAEPEDMDPRREGFDEQALDFILGQLRRGNLWGWCSVCVEAKYTTEDGEEVAGRDYLGGCSYRSRQDFIENSGYYDDMKVEAYNDLCHALEKLGYRKV